MNKLNEMQMFLENKSEKIKKIEQDPTITPREKDEKIASMSRFNNKHGTTQKKDDVEDVDSTPLNQLNFELLTSIEGDFVVTNKNVGLIASKINEILEKLDIDSRSSVIGSDINFSKIKNNDLLKITKKLVTTSNGYENKNVSINPYNFSVVDMGDSFEIQFYIADEILFSIVGEPKDSVIKESIAIRTERYL